MNEIIINLALSILLTSGADVKTDEFINNNPLIFMGYYNYPTIQIFLFEISSKCELEINAAMNSAKYRREFSLPISTCRSVFEKAKKKSDKKIINILNEEFKTMESKNGR
jgi:hypothetical protein